MHSPNIRSLLALRHRTHGESAPHTAPSTKPHHREPRPLRTEQLAALLMEIDPATESIVLGVGYGVSPTTFSLLQALATRLQAEMIGTRPAVDAGLIPPTRMVGQSGISIAPTYYLAFGISGQQLHTVGIEQSRHIVAINTDPTARLCHMADYVVVDDAHHVVNELLRNLQKRKSA